MQMYPSYVVCAQVLLHLQEVSFRKLDIPYVQYMHLGTGEAGICNCLYIPYMAHNCICLMPHIQNAAQ